MNSDELILTRFGYDERIKFDISLKNYWTKLKRFLCEYSRLVVVELNNNFGLKIRFCTLNRVYRLNDFFR